MERFYLIVIGSVAVTNMVSKASQAGLDVALVDQGPTGGACLNSGSIPSKMLICPADVIRSIHDAGVLGVHAEVNEVDFKRVTSSHAPKEAGLPTVNGGVKFLNSGGIKLATYLKSFLPA
jgi:pyruvate/2-oxoglutarate dehydrogenase complex dihydrolipoamide dehydrogenase (E3) component